MKRHNRRGVFTNMRGGQCPGGAKSIAVAKWVRRYAFNTLDMIKDGSKLTRRHEGELFQHYVEALPSRESDHFMNLCIRLLSCQKNFPERAKGKWEKEGIEDWDDFTRIVFPRNWSGQSGAFFRVMLKELGKTFQHRLQNPIKPESGRLKAIQQSLDLSPVETDLLRLFFCYDQNSSLEAILDEYFQANLHIPFIAKAIGHSAHKVKSAMSRKAKLTTLGVMVDARHGSVELHDTVSEYLDGRGQNAFEARYFERGKKNSLTLSDFDMAEKNQELIQNLLCSAEPARILLYGAPGTGKTELAKTLTQTIKAPAYWIKHSEDDEMINNRLALTVVSRMAEKNKGVMVFDEADDFFEARARHPFFSREKGSQTKAWTNHFLDHSRARMIWITNEINYVEKSILRRFTYSLKFKDFSRNKRLMYMNKALKKSPLEKYITKDFINEISQYKVNVDAFASALKFCEALYAKGRRPVTKKRLEHDLRELMAKKHQLLHEEKIYRGSHIKEKYDPAVLRTDTSLGQVQSSLKHFMKCLKCDDDDESQSTGPQQMNLLFYGASGTGKSAFGHHLAEKLNCELIFKRASDILSPYVGMSERLIRDAFEEAEESQGILLIDEADSFLSDRRSHLRTWESSMVNEFLATMENYRGILICTSNLNTKMDFACARRFHWKIRFLPLSIEGSLSLFQKYFGKHLGRALRAEQKKELGRINGLSPGDFRSVWNRLETGLHGKEPAAQFRQIVTELEKEAKYRREGTKGELGFR